VGVPPAFLSPSLRLLAAVLLVAPLALQPTGVVHAQADASCDQISQQLDSTNQDLDQLKDASAPWLQQAAQFGSVATAELLAAAQQGLPGLDPGTAAGFGAIAAQVGAAIDTWRLGNSGADSAGYWRDLSNALSTWHTLFAPLTPFQTGVASLAGLSTALGELDQLAARATGDLALSDSLNAALQDCQSSETSDGSGSMPDAADAPQALCSVGGTQGYSNSQCFSLELDAAYAVWQACTEAYFAAEDAAFANGGDLPANNCDGPFKAETERLQQQWGGAP
jgi:hypothetical protein